MELITWMLLTLLVPIVSLFFIQLVIQRIRFLRKMGLIPNPKSYPIIGNIIDFMVPHKYLQDVIKLHIKNYPKLFNLWLGPVATVTLVKPQHLEVILGNAKYIDKTFHYSFLGPWLGTGLLTSTGTKWHSHRKLITPTFHFKILENFVEVFAEKSEILVKKLQKEEGKESFNVYPHITKCALDIICETAMGTEINAQTQEVNSDYVKAVYEISEVVMNRVLSPWLYLDFIFKMTPSGRRLKNCVKILHSFTNKVIRERKQYYRLQNSPESSDEDRMIGRRKRMAFLDLLLDASEKGNNLTDEEIREEVDTFMFEGHDTTTAAICWALHLLGAHPHIQSKVYEELDNIFQGSDRPPTMKDLNEMKYLERVIKESLRLYPSVPMIGRKLVQDVEIDGYTIPAGVNVMLLPYFTHRDPEHFPNPEKFDPDNFLPERVAKRHPYAYVPFSAGPRNCIGQKFALLEEKTVLSYILRHYKVCSVNEEIIAIPELILRAENGVHLTITRREKCKS